MNIMKINKQTEILKVSVLLRGDITKRMYETWQKQLPERIAVPRVELTSLYDVECDFVVAYNNCQLPNLLSWMKVKKLPNKVTIITPAWLIESLKQSKLLNPDRFRHILMDNNEVSSNSSMPPEEVTDYEYNSSYPENSDDDETDTRKIKRQKRSHSTDINADTDSVIAFEKEHVDSKISTNQNKSITDVLDGLKEVYEASGDRWRALVYKRASATLKELPQITDISQLEGVTGIGKSVRDKIMEILETGSLQKLEKFQEDPKIQAVQQFSNILWVGPSIAETLYKKGYTSIDDLRARGEHELTPHQRIGLKYYEELLEKIPRAEVAEIEQYVNSYARRILPGTNSIICGSYLRGLPESGDVDFILTPPHGHFDLTFLPELVYRLESVGFLTDHLSLPPGYSEYVKVRNKVEKEGVKEVNGTQKDTSNTKKIEDSSLDHFDSFNSNNDSNGFNVKELEQYAAKEMKEFYRIARPLHKERHRVTYMGICKLNNEPDSKHRRIDIWTYPRDLYPFAILYFSGPDHFERSIRHYAKQLGYHLNDHGLYPVNEEGEVIGPSVECRTERDIFAALGVEYKDYHERNVFQNLKITEPKVSMNHVEKG